MNENNITKQKIIIANILKKLSYSKFRSSFQLKPEQRKYIEEKGIDTIKQHAKDFIAKRLSPAIIPNDGKQTPMKGHPIFIAQHATATCCRGCLYKWYQIPKNRELTQAEQNFILKLILEWIKNQIKK